MLQISRDDNNIITSDAEALLKNIILKLIPNSWQQEAKRIMINQDGLSARIFATVDNYLDAAISYDDDNNISSINFSWPNGNESWTATPMNVMCLKAQLEPSNEPVRSPWASRQELIDEAFGTFTTEPQTSEDYDDEYALDPAFAWNICGLYSNIDKFWYNIENTVRKYFKDNNVKRTNIFTVFNIKAIAMDDYTSLLAELQDNTIIDFTNLSIGQQISIVEELLLRQ